MARQKFATTSFLNLITKVSTEKVTEQVIPTIGSFLYKEESVNVLALRQPDLKQANFAELKPSILKSFGIPPQTEVVSVAGDSQPTDKAGTIALQNSLNQYFTATSNRVALFGVTGRPFGDVADINGALTQVVSKSYVSGKPIKCIGQVVQQSVMAVTNWGCETLEPEQLRNLLLVTGSTESPTVFGDDTALDGQINTSALDKVLRIGLSRCPNLPEEIASWIKTDADFTNIQRQQMMYFAVEKKLDLSSIMSFEDLIKDGIGSSAFIGSGGGQTFWQATLNVVLGKPIHALGGLRGPTNPKTTVLENGVPTQKDFLDTAEFLGYLKDAKQQGHQDYFELQDKYFNGLQNSGYPLSGVRMAYNPGNSDVARKDEANGGLNSKLRMITEANFILGCLGGYRNQLDPEKIHCEVLVRDLSPEPIPFEEAAKKGFAPTVSHPLSGLYHLEMLQYLNGVPCHELHLHLDGTNEAEMIWAKAQKHGIELPYESFDKFKEAFNFRNLGEFLNLYFTGAKVFFEEQDFQDLAYAYLKKAHEQGVTHTEVFVGPQTHNWKKGVTTDTVLNGTIAAIRQAEKEFGITAGIIIDFDRSWAADKSVIGKLETDPETGELVIDPITGKPNPAKEWTSASEVDAPQDARKTYEQIQNYLSKNPDAKPLIYGFGIDYAEKGFPPRWFGPLFDRIREDGYKTVAHAGEEGPPDYIKQAIEILHVSRIDHGNSLINDPELLQRVIDSRIPLTMCPLSNLSLKVIKDLGEHPFKKLMEKGVIVTFNSDDPAFFTDPETKKGYIKDNYLAIAKKFNLSFDDFRQIAENSIIASFQPERVKEQHLEKLNTYHKEFMARRERQPLAPEQEAVVAPYVEEGGGPSMVIDPHSVDKIEALEKVTERTHTR